MPRFHVIREVERTFIEEWEIDADDEDDARDRAQLDDDGLLLSEQDQGIDRVDIVSVVEIEES